MLSEFDKPSSHPRQAPRDMNVYDRESWWREWRQTALPVAVTLALLALGLANVVSRATSNEVEDGVLWVERAVGVVAAEVASPSAASRAGVKPGDILLAIDKQPVDARLDVITLQHQGRPGDRHTYTLLRLGSQEVANLSLSPMPSGAGLFYYVLAAVGIFTLLVGAAVRARRPTDQATLHFFWLSVAFFGLFTFSFSGRLDRVDWVFYWGDAIAVIVLPPLFLHFALVFPERPHMAGYSATLARWLPAIYLPGAVLGSTRALAVLRSGFDPEYFVRVISLLDRLEYIYLTAYFGAGLAVLVRALSRARSVTVKRQLRWIVWGTTFGALPFAIGYAIPFALGVDPSLPMGLSAVPLGFVPLAFASAIIRYRLMDVEIILKRLLIYTSAVAAIVAIYVLILQASGGYLVEGENQHRWIIAFLATVVVILLAKPVKDGLQHAIDRAFYRDRYDYRRALVSFARELNSDLDLNRLADRMVTRVRETIELDRMAFLLATDEGDFESISHEGLEQAPPKLSGASGIGSRLHSAHTVRLDDPMAATRFTAEEIEFWRDNGLFYFVPCVAKDAAIAVLALGRRASGEPLSTEDTALVTAVAAQAATAIENGRLYRQLHLKASELDRLHAFNENILESLDDGLLVIGPGDNVIRWNASLESLYGLRRTAVLGKTVDRLFDAPVVELLNAVRKDHPDGKTAFRVPIAGRGTREGQTLLVNLTTVPLQTIAGGSGGGHHRHHRRHHRALADGRAAAHLREDGVARSARGRRRARSEHAADRDFELHADAARERRSRGPAHAAARKNREADVPRRQDRQRPAESVAAKRGGCRRAVGGRPQRGDRRRVVAARTSVREGQHQGAPRAPRRAGARRRLRIQAAAGVPESVPQRARRDAERRVAGHRDAGRPRRSGGRGRRYRQRHCGRAPGAHLRSVFHHQTDGPGHRPRPLDHLRHRPRARRHHSVR